MNAEEPFGGHTTERRTVTYLPEFTVLEHVTPPSLDEDNWEGLLGGERGMYAADEQFAVEHGGPVTRYPLMFDSASLLTASFEECLVATEDAEVSGDVGQYRSAVEELEDVWDALVLKAVNGRGGFYPEETRGVLSTARKLAVKAESTDSSDERMELLRKAVELGNQTTVRVPDDLASRLTITAV